MPELFSLCRWSKPPLHRWGVCPREACLRLTSPEQSKFIQRWRRWSSNWSVAHSCLCLTPLCRNQLKAEYLMSMESSEGLLEEIGAQALTAGVYQAPDAVLKAIDAITQNDVVKVCAFNEILIAWLNKQLQKNKQTPVLWSNVYISSLREWMSW